MLSDQERRRVRELELQLQAEDPRFAGKFQPIAGHMRGRLIVALLVMIAGVVTGAIGFVQADVPIAITGILLVGTGACIAAGWHH